MTFLPVVARELRVASRRRQTYWTRFFAALATLALCTWIWGWLTENQPAHERGQVLFRVISGLAFAYSLFAGISITADSLSEEKREGTLGLLFLTDLHGYDVVSGKLVATSLNAFYRLLSVFPILAVPLLLGALTLGEFWRMVLVLSNTLFFSLAIGMVVSSISLHERRAMAGTLLLLLIITAGPALIGALVYYGNRSVPYNQAWLLSSGVYPLILAFDTFYQKDSFQFWSAVATTHGLAWAALVLGSVLVRQSWQDRPLSGPVGGWREWWQEWRFGKGEQRTAWRQRLLEANPISWLAGRDRLRPAYVIAVLFGLGLVWLWLYIKYPRAMTDSGMHLFTSYCLHALLKLWLASEACRPLAEDRRSGALELLLSTPLSTHELLEGYLLAFRRQFLGPVLAVLAVDMVMIVGGTADQLLDSSNNWLFFWLGLMVMLVADLYTIAWVGLWLSLSAKKGSRAAAGTVARVLVLPWAVFILGLSLLAASNWARFEASEFGLLSSAFAIAFLTDALLFAWAKTNLHERFRLVATQRFAAGPSRQVEVEAPPPGLVPPVPAQ